MRPLAPGLFSTMTGWPNFARGPSATSRAERSVMPAGGNGTISRMGREGNDCAAAAPESSRQRSRLKRRLRSDRLVMMHKGRRPHGVSPPLRRGSRWDPGFKASRLQIALPRCLAPGSKTTRAYPPKIHDYMLTIRIEPNRGSVVGRVALEGKAVQILDIREDSEYKLTEPMRQAGTRTLLGVPLLRQGVPIGVLLMIRRRVEPFTEKQIELITTFADQAVIAIENVRLFDEVQARTRELSESLERQTATSEVLEVISSSPTQVQPVFEAMVARAAELCQAHFSAVARFENGLLHLLALNNLSPEEREAFHSLFPRPPARNFVMGRAFVDGKPVQFDDVLAEF